MQINKINFEYKKIGMTIPTDISKMINLKKSEYTPVFGNLNIKPIVVPISDTFVHILN